MSRRIFLLGMLFGLFGLLLLPTDQAYAGKAQPVRYLRFQVGDTVAYGILEGERVRKLSGDLFGEFEPTNTTYPLSKVKILAPTKPTQVFAMAGNYKSHLGDSNVTTTTITTVTKIVAGGKKKTDPETKATVDIRTGGSVPKKFRVPQPFFKSPSCILAHGENIVLPAEAEVVHYEAELVVVIGKKAKKVSKDKALDYVLGVTCGNDVSARMWQRGDVQWWRAKGSDTFGPCGPYIVAGLDYDNLEMQLRLNGEVKQETRTSEMIHDIASTVSFISQHVTLQPGDLIFTGTPGKTSEIKPGDVVEVEVEGVGTLRNAVVAE